MSLSPEVAYVIQTFQELPQSWLADVALAAVTGESGTQYEGRDYETHRTEALLVRVRERIDTSIWLLGVLPEAIAADFGELGDGLSWGEEVVGDVAWVDQEGTERVYGLAPPELEEFRKHAWAFISDVIRGLDRPPGAPVPPDGGGMPPSGAGGSSGSSEDEGLQQQVEQRRQRFQT